MARLGTRKQVPAQGEHSVSKGTPRLLGTSPPRTPPLRRQDPKLPHPESEVWGMGPYSQRPGVACALRCQSPTAYHWPARTNTCSGWRPPCTFRWPGVTLHAPVRSLSAAHPREVVPLHVPQLGRARARHEAVRGQLLVQAARHWRVRGYQEQRPAQRVRCEGHGMCARAEQARLDKLHAHFWPHKLRRMTQQGPLHNGTQQRLCRCGKATCDIWGCAMRWPCVARPHVTSGGAPCAGHGKTTAASADHSTHARSRA
jgi:hypothetical protein